MTHRPLRITPTIAALAAGLGLAAAPVARADRLETPVEAGANLAAAAGWQAWSTETAPGTHRLQLRRPDGSVTTPEIPAFGAPVDPAIGTRGGADAINTPASRRLSAVYSRCAGDSALAGCDVFALDLTTLTEEKVAALATKAYSETVPSLTFGNWSLVRRGGGPAKGTYAYSERSGRLRRLSPTLARETATSVSRMAFTYNSSRGFGLQIRQSSGDGRPLVAAARLQLEPRSPQLTRYRAGWLLPGDGVTRVFQTRRFAGSGGPFTLRVDEAPRTLPAGVRSAAGDSSTLFERYLDEEGVQRIDPAIR